MGKNSSASGIGGMYAFEVKGPRHALAKRLLRRLCAHGFRAAAGASSARPEQPLGTYPAGPSHCGPPSTSSGRGRPRLARRRRRVLPAAASAATCRRVGARLRRGDRVVAARGSRLDERSNQPWSAFSARRQLQHLHPRRPPLHCVDMRRGGRQGVFRQRETGEELEAEPVASVGWVVFKAACTMPA